MTKREALALFRSDILPSVVQRYGSHDKPVIREAWNNWTDILCKDRQITQRQYDTWIGPF